MLEEPTTAVNSISPSTKVLALTADLTKEADVEAVFQQAVNAFGTVDVVLHAAGSFAGGPVGDIEPNAWFNDYEVNVKGSYTLAYYYLKSVASGSGTFIILGTLGASFTAPGMSSYSGSKMALLKLAEYLDAEKSNLRVFTVHPGIVAATETKRGMVVDQLTPFAKDTGIQTGGLSLYLAQPNADYLRGSFVSVNCKLSFRAKIFAFSNLNPYADVLQGMLMKWKPTSRRSLSKSYSSSVSWGLSLDLRVIRGLHD